MKKFLRELLFLVVTFLAALVINLLFPDGDQIWVSFLGVVTGRFIYLYIMRDDPQDSGQNRSEQNKGTVSHISWKGLFKRIILSAATYFGLGFLLHFFFPPKTFNLSSYIFFFVALQMFYICGDRKDKQPKE